MLQSLMKVSEKQPCLFNVILDARCVVSLPKDSVRTVLNVCTTKLVTVNTAGNRSLASIRIMSHVHNAWAMKPWMAVPQCGCLETTGSCGRLGARSVGLMVFAEPTPLLCEQRSFYELFHLISLIHFRVLSCCPGRIVACALGQSIVGSLSCDLLQG